MRHPFIAASTLGALAGLVIPLGPSAPTPTDMACRETVARYVSAYGESPTIAVVNHFDDSSDFYAMPHSYNMVCGYPAKNGE